MFDFSHERWQLESMRRSQGLKERASSYRSRKYHCMGRAGGCLCEFDTAFAPGRFDGR